MLLLLLLLVLSNGRVALAYSQSSEVEIYSTETGEVDQTLRHNHTADGDGVTCMNNLRDNQLVIALREGGGGQCCVIWRQDRVSGLYVQHRQLFPGHSEGVRCVTELVVDNTACLVTGSDDYTIRVVLCEEKLAESTEGPRSSCGAIATMRGHTDAVTCLAVITIDDNEGPSQRIVSGSADYTLRIWSRVADVEKPSSSSLSEIVGEEAEESTNHRTSVAADPSTSTLISYTCLHVLRGHTFPIKEMLVTFNQRILSYADDNHFRVWDPKDGTCDKARYVAESLAHVCQLSDGQYLACTYDNKFKIYDYDLQATRSNRLGGLRGDLQVSGSVTAVDVLSDGRLLVSSEAASDCLLYVIDDYLAESSDLNLQDDDSNNSKSNSNNDNTKEVEGSDCHPFSVKSMLLTRQGKCLVSIGTNDKCLRVWDCVTGVCAHVLEGHTSRVNCIVLQSIGDYERVISGKTNTRPVPVIDTCLFLIILFVYTYIGSHDYTIRLWSCMHWTCERVIDDVSANITCLAVRSDGRFIAGSGDRNLRVWSCTGDVEHTLMAHTGLITCVSVLRDGRVVSGSTDKSIRIWDVITGVVERTLKADNDQIRSITLIGKDSGSDSERLIAEDYFHDLYLWDIDSGAYQKISLATCKYLIQCEKEKGHHVTCPTAAVTDTSNQMTHWQSPSTNVSVDDHSSDWLTELKEIDGYGLDVSTAVGGHCVCKCVATETVAYGLDNGDVFLLRQKNNNDCI